jgi:peptide/nickel transport system ATP-binding protein
MATSDGTARRTIISGIDLDLARGEAIAIVGESGSGKSFTARAIVRLLPKGIVATGAVHFDGMDLMALTERELRAVRGRRVSILFQYPFRMLNPLMRAGSVIDEMLPARQPRQAGRPAELRRRLAEVGIDEAGVLDRMPFQLSGGMCQRVAIAAALARDPELLIADEPSTAFDVTTNAEIMTLLRRIQAERGMGMTLITHDLRLAFSTCQRVYVLYAGSLVEVGDIKEVESNPHHPYTLGLLMAEPPTERRVPLLTAIPGSAPSPDDVAGRCVFADRCNWAVDPCRVRKPPRLEVGPGRHSACVRWSDIESQMRAFRKQNLESGPDPGRPPTRERALVSVRDLAKTFVLRRGRTLQALTGVSLEILPAESVVLIGESGAGKTTIARCLIGLETPTAGMIEVAGVPATNFGAISREERPRLLRMVQMVFQDAYSTLDPRHSVRRSLSEALRVAGTPMWSVEARIRILLREVELPETRADRRPVSLSGGERQRVAIARALAARPKILVCDEPSPPWISRCRRTFSISSSDCREGTGFPTSSSPTTRPSPVRWPIECTCCMTEGSSNTALLMTSLPASGTPTRDGSSTRRSRIRGPMLYVSLSFNPAAPG